MLVRGGAAGQTKDQADDEHEPAPPRQHTAAGLARDFTHTSRQMIQPAARGGVPPIPSRSLDPKPHFGCAVCVGVVVVAAKCLHGKENRLVMPAIHHLLAAMPRTAQQSLIDGSLKSVRCSTWCLSNKDSKMSISQYKGFKCDQPKV